MLLEFSTHKNEAAEVNYAKIKSIQKEVVPGLIYVQIYILIHFIVTSESFRCLILKKLYIIAWISSITDIWQHSATTLKLLNSSNVSIFILYSQIHFDILDIIDVYRRVEGLLQSSKAGVRTPLGEHLLPLQNRLPIIKFQIALCHLIRQKNVCLSLMLGLPWLLQ